MAKIKKLSTSVIAQIAAGEVIDRPASVVRELIDNAIDAQATKISIYLENAGTSKIIITDNGIGMDKQDLELCFKRHTTSKINPTSDLLSIKSLGFRGEALYSIATASTLIIQSKTKKSTVGFEITISNQKNTSPKPIGMPSGTTIKVENLFSNFPARKKFLKTPQTELRHVVSIVIKYALAFPQIKFAVNHHEKKVLDLPKSDTTKERILQIFGNEFCQMLLPISHQYHTYTLQGFIGAPAIARKSSVNQFFFVNNRPITTSLFARHIKAAYGGLIEPKSRPVFFINVIGPSHLFDVNIHPQKQKVGFVNSMKLHHHIKNTIQQTLSENDITYNLYRNQNKQYEICDNNYFQNQQADTKTLQHLKSLVSLWETTNTRQNNEIIQLHDLYLITQTKNGVLIIDQHAAHERILYEQILTEYQKQTSTQQIISPAIPLSLTKQEKIVIEENQEIFSAIGFHFKQSDQEILTVTKAPDLLPTNHIQKIITEIIDDLLNEEQPTTTFDIIEKTISFLACRMAIKQGDRLSIEERRNLIQQLSRTKTNYTCPHGRPTHIILSLDQMGKLFKRH